MLPHQIPHHAKLMQWKEIAPDVRHFWFEIPGMEKFDFIPGQWVSLTHPLNGKKMTRAYSIASTPYKNRFELCLNLVQEGSFSPFLFSLSPGDTVEMKGPHGLFIMKKPAGNSIYVATGTGIAPFRPMIRHALRIDKEHEFVLIFGVRYENAILYKEEFEQMERDHANFRFICTVTRPSPAWKGNSGRIHQYLWNVIGHRRDFDVYICGLKEMVNDVRDKLKALGFDRKQIIYERYD